MFHTLRLGIKSAQWAQFKIFQYSVHCMTFIVVGYIILEPVHIGFRLCPISRPRT